MKVENAFIPVIPQMPDSRYNRGSNLHIKWAGPQLGDHEQLFCMLVAGGKSTGTSQKAGTGNSIIISASQLSDLPAGEAFIQLIRTSSDSISHKDNYSMLRKEYHAEPLRITLE